MDTVDIAASLALASALCVAIGDVMQQRATHGIVDQSLALRQQFAKLLRNRRWVVGVLILVVSIALQAAALNQGSVLLVQALLVLSLLFAIPFSAKLEQRSVTSREWIWAIVLTAAVTVIVTVGNPQAGRSNASLRDLGRRGGGAGAAAGRVPGGRPHLGRCAGRGAVRLRLGHAVGNLRGAHQGRRASTGRRRLGGVPHPELYAWMLVALGGFVWEQSAFRAGALTASMPTLQVSQPVVAALLGVVVLDEIAQHRRRRDGRPSRGGAGDDDRHRPARARRRRRDRRKDRSGTGSTAEQPA